MLRTGLFCVAVVTAGCATVDRSSIAALATDREAIAELHSRDMAAARRGDTETLISLWTEDAVMLPPNGGAVIGIDAIAELMRASAGQMDTLEVTEYVQDFEELLIMGDVAFEWGTYRGTTRSRSSGETASGSGTLMRLLRKQHDGSWKVARSMWTAETS